MMYKCNLKARENCHHGKYMYFCHCFLLKTPTLNGHGHYLSQKNKFIIPFLMFTTLHQIFSNAQPKFDSQWSSY